MSSSPMGRIAAVAGLIFAVLFTAGTMSAGSGAADTTEEYVRYFEDSGHQTTAVIACYTLVASAIAFLVFVVGIRSRIVASTTPAGSLEMLVVVFGLVVAIATVVGGTATAAVSGYAKFSGGSPIPQDGAVLQSFESLGFGLFVIGASLSGAACVVAASIAAFKYNAFPQWHGILGLVCGFTLLFGVIVPPIGLPIWALATSVVLWRGRGALAAAPNSGGRLGDRESLVSAR